MNEGQITPKTVKVYRTFESPNIFENFVGAICSKMQ
jgi:hypothetical protein